LATRAFAEGRVTEPRKGKRVALLYRPARLTGRGGPDSASGQTSADQDSDPGVDLPGRSPDQQRSPLEVTFRPALSGFQSLCLGLQPFGLGLVRIGGIGNNHNKGAVRRKTEKNRLIFKELG